METKIISEFPVSFHIEEVENIFEGDHLLSFGNSSRRMVVIDRNICRFYLEQVTAYFQEREITTHIVAINATEDDKNLENLLLILREMEQFGLLRRNEPVIAIGGGVLLDLVGFAASIYRRGVPYIRVPTTLVGLVDASVGIKTGINFENRRNRLGSYHPPLASFLDRTFLLTLPPIELSSGMGEILKMAVIKDKELFEFLELDGTLLGKAMNSFVIQQSIMGMVEELTPNLWETNLQRLVDFGHSFSPIIEMRSLQTDYPLTHGQAVTLDIIFSSMLSSTRGILPQEELKRIIQTAKKFELPISHPLFWEPLLLLESLNDTVKHRNGVQNLPIPSRIGTGQFLNDVTLLDIKIVVDLWKDWIL